MHRGRHAGDELLTVPQVLAELGDVSRRTFYRWRELGNAPPGIKLPNGEIRIWRSEFLAWLEKLRESGMSTSTDVRLWGVRRNKSSGTPSYEARWVVAGREKSRTRRTRALAESFLSELRQAARRGESFDVATGLPESMLRAATGTTWYAFVLGYVDKRWPGLAAHTRKSMLEALGTVTAALVHDQPYRPDFAELYRALVRYGLAPGSRTEARPLTAAQVLRWLESASVPMVAMEDEDLVERALAAIALRLDGNAAAATVTRRSVPCSTTSSMSRLPARTGY